MSGVSWRGLMGRFVAEVLGFPYLAETFPMHSNLTGGAPFTVCPAYLSGCFPKRKVLSHTSNLTGAIQLSTNK